MAGWASRIRSRVLNGIANRLVPPELDLAVSYLRDAGSAAFPPRKAGVARDLPRGNVLVLAPHPDDEVIGMGGALLAHLDNGSSVTVVYLTDGAGLPDTARASTVALRRNEAEEVGRLTGMSQIFWDKPDTNLTDDADTVSDLVRILKELQPDCIYLPSFFDRHYDHFASNAILVAALRFLDHPTLTVLGYEVWDGLPFHNYVVDVSAYMGRRRQIMEAYETPLRVTNFKKLFDCRGSVNYLLYVDSRIDSSENKFAEIYIRHDSVTYSKLFRSYASALSAHKSPLLRNLTLSKPGLLG